MALQTSGNMVLQARGSQPSSGSASPFPGSQESDLADLAKRRRSAAYTVEHLKSVQQEVNQMRRLSEEHAPQQPYRRLSLSGSQADEEELIEMGPAGVFGVWESIPDHVLNNQVWVDRMEEHFSTCLKVQRDDVALLGMLGARAESRLQADYDRILEYFRYKNSLLDMEQRSVKREQRSEKSSKEANRRDDETEDAQGLDASTVVEEQSQLRGGTSTSSSRLASSRKTLVGPISPRKTIVAMGPDGVSVSPRTPGTARSTGNKKNTSSVRSRRGASAAPK
mmetsp:Transcript_64192/g.137866  ORF Transcript_64192/g.137866 Transcript_64192/m.137866 type:complete len:280 (-) Transcript_64192:110-949(-)